MSDGPNTATQPETLEQHRYHSFLLGFREQLHRTGLDEEGVEIVMQAWRAAESAEYGRENARQQAVGYHCAEILKLTRSGEDLGAVAYLARVAAAFADDLLDHEVNGHKRMAEWEQECARLKDLADRAEIFREQIELAEGIRILECLAEKKTLGLSEDDGDACESADPVDMLVSMIAASRLRLSEKLESAEAERDTLAARIEQWVDGVFGDIGDERNRQDEQWGGPEHDDAHPVEEWCDFIDKQNKTARSIFVNAFSLGISADEAVRARMVKIAALAVACCEVLDRAKVRREALLADAPDGGPR